MSTEEGNKLIAEFMGQRYISKYGFANQMGYEYDSEEEGIKVWWSENHLKYNWDWSWLMPVVEKIEALTAIDGRGEVNYIVSIEEMQCIISQGGEGELYFRQSEVSKIEATWLAVIDFIQWYNSNK